MTVKLSIDNFRKDKILVNVLVVHRCANLLCASSSAMRKGKRKALRAELGSVFDQVAR